MFSITILVQLEKKLNQKEDFQIKIPLTTFMMMKILILFFITTTDSQEVISIIYSLSDNKSFGSNSISKRILKLLKKDISTQLVDIFNLSFSSGIYPTPLKTAKVISIHKKDSKFECSNYRPIALLSNIDKILEKLMHRRLSNFLDKNQLIYSLQFGFRQNYILKIGNNFF